MSALSYSQVMGVNDRTMVWYIGLETYGSKDREGQQSFKEAGDRRQAGGRVSHGATACADRALVHFGDTAGEYFVQDEELS